MKPRQIKKVIRNLELIGDTYTSIVYYKKYCEKVPDDYSMMLKLGAAYRKSRNYKAAADLYKKIYEGDPKKNGIALYYHGTMMMMQGNYRRAEESLKLFKKAYRGREIDSKMYKNVLKGCQIALAEKEANNEDNAEIYHLDTSINKVNIEFSPMYLNDSSIIYGSYRTNDLETYSLEYNEKTLPVRKFYSAQRIDELQWKSTGSWMEDIFSNKTDHTGNGALSPNGKRFYFSRCKPSWNNQVICELYLSTFSKEEGWSEPERLNDEINMPGYTSTMPTVGTESRRNKEVLYFVSDRPKGRGGLDIWYTIYNNYDSTYSSPKNCGSKINSVSDDITPYYNMKTRTMYYSTEFLPGYGGLDIFKARGEQSRFVRPINLGYPINSEADDLYFVLNPNNRTEGFIVSNRKGSNSIMHSTCCDDIYSFKLKDFVLVTFTGKIFEAETKPDSMFFKSEIVSLLNDTSSTDEIMMIDTNISKIITAQVKNDNTNSKRILEESRVMVYLIDSETNEEVYLMSDTLDINNGKYRVELDPGEDYKLVFAKDGYFNKSINVTTKGYNKSDSVLLKDVALEVIPRDPIKFNIYYGFDKAELNDESKRVIDSTLLNVLLATPDLIVEISSHTDNRGDSLYNKDLSQRRAESVVNYLTEKGIDKTRLIAIGYGQSKPVVTNDTNEGRAKNRRTEFRVIGSIDQFSKLNTTDLKITKKRNVPNSFLIE